jgi:hypothetical protein
MMILKVKPTLRGLKKKKKNVTGSTFPTKERKKKDIHFAAHFYSTSNRARALHLHMDFSMIIYRLY